jgi:hypothetical protein
MIDVDFVTFALKILVEDFGIAVLPPAAQLSVPRARQNVEELLVIETNETEEILIAQMTLERVFLS